MNTHKAARSRKSVIGIQFSRVGHHRGTRRLWFEGRRLARARFLPGLSFEIRESGSMLEIVLEEAGDRVVSSRKRRGDTLPIIDINGGAVERTLGDCERIVATFEKGRIVIAVHPADRDARERLNRLIRRVVQHQPLSFGSLAHGAGILDHALHSGLRDRGFSSELTFAVEKDPHVLEVALANNPIWSDEALAIEGRVEDVDPAILPRIDILAAGLPCTGASVAGRAKNAIATAEEHETAGPLFHYFLGIVKACQPAVVVLENVPPYRTTAGMTVIRAVMDDLGYDLHETILDGNEMGALEMRRRFCAVAVTRGVPFDFSKLAPVRGKEQSIAEIIDRDDPRSRAFRSMDGLRAKEKRDRERGQNFKMQIVDEDSAFCTALGAHYYKVRSTEPKLSDPGGSENLRQFTPIEHARLKTVPEPFIRDISDTLAHRVLGQGVIHAAFVAVGRLIGDSLTRLVAPA